MFIVKTKDESGGWLQIAVGAVFRMSSKPIEVEVSADEIVFVDGDVPDYTEEHVVLDTGKSLANWVWWETDGAGHLLLTDQDVFVVQDGKTIDRLRAVV